jgi:type I restriction enzyme S subunit
LVSGTTNQVELSTSKVLDLPVPCPPVPEQQRIVAKVDELMTLCDKLEAQQQERDRCFPQVSAALHAQFVESPTSAMLRDLLSGAVDASPDDLHKSILTLAVQGKLTSKSEDYANLSWQQAGIESEFAEELSGFEFPMGWRIQRLEDVAETVVDCPHSTPKWTSSGKICVRTNQFRPGYLDLNDSRFVSEEIFHDRTRRLAPQGDDVLYSREGGILGVACRVPFDTDLCLGQRMMLIRTGPDISPAFLETVLNSPLITGIAKSRTTGGAAPRVNMKTVRAYPIPVPPLDEQDDIVRKVDQLMKLIAKLEYQIRQKSSAAETLAQAAVAAITGTATQESKPMKAPKTELVTRLEVDRSRNRQPGDDEPLASLLAEHEGVLTAKALWQRSGLAIDAFYQQLKTEMAAGWILEPEPAQMREVASD